MVRIQKHFVDLKLLNINFSTGDTYLNFRLKELVRAGKIEAKGKLKNRTGRPRNVR